MGSEIIRAPRYSSTVRGLSCQTDHGIAEPALRQALRADPSLEARRRIDALLEIRDRETSDPPPEKLRALRAIEALEWAGTAEAREVLRRLVLPLRGPTWP